MPGQRTRPPLRPAQPVRMTPPFPAVCALHVANCKHNWFGLQTARYFDRVNCDYRNNIMSRSFLTTIVAVLITIISLLSIVVMTSTRAESAECPILKEHQDHIYMFYLVSPELRNKIRRKIREGYVMEFRPDFVNWTSEETTVLVEWEWYSYYTWMSIYSTYKLFTGPDGGPSRWQSTEWETGKISSLLSGEISGYDAVFLVRQYDLDSDSRCI